MNDPLESNILEIGLTGYAGISISTSADQEDFSLCGEKEKYHILSMSSNCVDPLMWAHYADNYCGVCLCFSTYGKCFERFEPVEYVQERQEYDWVDNSKEIERLIRKSFLMKNDEWRYEREWRLIKRFKQEKKRYWKFDPKALRGIIFGQNIDREVENTIKASLPPPNIKILKTYIGHRTFKIHLLDIDYNISLDGSEPDYRDDIEKYLLV